MDFSVSIPRQVAAMASFMNSGLRPSSSNRHFRNITNSTRAVTASTTQHLIQQQLRFSEPISRRSAILISSSVPFGLTWLPQPSEARERRNRKNIPLEDYATSRKLIKPHSFLWMLPVLLFGRISIWCLLFLVSLALSVSRGLIPKCN